MRKLVVMCTEDRVATMNPEELLENGETANSLLGRPEPAKASASKELAARNLAKILLDSSPIALARLLEEFGENGGHTPAVGNAIVELLSRKVADATPDELNEIVHQAKSQHVWQWVKPSILERNDGLARQVLAIENPDALDTFLDTVALTSGNMSWLPGPVYDAAIRVVRQLATSASIAQLDKLGDLSWRWRFKKKVSTSIRKRHKELIKSVEQFYCGNGYVMQAGSKTILVENPSRALRLAEQGFAFVPKGE